MGTVHVVFMLPMQVVCVICEETEAANTHTLSAVEETPRKYHNNAHVRFATEDSVSGSDSEVDEENEAVRTPVVKKQVVSHGVCLNGVSGSSCSGGVVYKNLQTVRNTAFPCCIGQT